MKYLVLLLLLITSPLHAAITHIGDTTANTCSSISSTTTLVCTTNAAVEAGNIHLVFVAANNVGTTDADHSEVTGVADSAGNIYTKLCEYTNGQGSAAAGATVSTWLSKITTELGIGGTFTITFANAIVSKAANGREYTVAAGKTLTQSSACQTEVVDGDFPGALAFSGLSNIERLYFRAIAMESNAGTNLTLTTNFTQGGTVVADTGSSASSMGVRAEFRIVTATGETSDPDLGNSNDQVSVFLALEETNVATTRPVAPFIFQ